MTIQLRKENIPEDILGILCEDFMLRKKEQEFTSMSMNQYRGNIILLKETLVRAQEQHNGQKQIINLVPNDEYYPYFSHPLSVALLAMSLRFPCRIIQACLLHDVVEDC